MAGLAPASPNPSFLREPCEAGATPGPTHGPGRHQLVHPSFLSSLVSRLAKAKAVLRSFSSATSLASTSLRAFVGHASTHAGCLPSASRSQQRLHLAITPPSALRIAPNGQTNVQLEQPMQNSRLNKTLWSFPVRLSAVLGQTAAQGASSHCWHWSGTD